MISAVIQKLVEGEELNIEEKLEITQFFNRLQNVPAQVETLFKKTSTITALSQITNNAGTQVAGSVGGWVLDTNKLTDAAGTVGMDSTVTVVDDIRIWAGNTTPASAPFRVTEAGALTATSATITGAITATSGAIGGWIVDATSIKDLAGVVGLSSAVTGGDDIRLFAGHVTPASAPFRVTEAGALTATSATITGAITATSGAIGGWVVDATSLKDVAGTVGMSSAVTGGDDIRFFAGNSTPASAPFRVTEAGVLTSTSASIAGWTIDSTTIQKLATNVGIILDSSASLIKVGDTGGTYIAIDGANKHIQSSNFVAGASGFHIDADSGDAEFNKLTARGMIKTAVFEKDTLSAIGGSMIVLDSDVLSTTMTALDNATLTIEGNTTFAVGDILRMKDGVDDEWFEVTNIGSAPTYTCTRDKAATYGADANPAWKKGQAVVNYGLSGDGGIIIESGATPAMKIFNHAGSPWSTLTVPVQLNETGVTIYPSSTSYNPQNSIKWYDGSTLYGYAITYNVPALTHHQVRINSCAVTGNNNYAVLDATQATGQIAYAILRAINGSLDPSIAVTSASEIYLNFTSLDVDTFIQANGENGWKFDAGQKSFAMRETASNPAYVDNYAKFYYLDTGNLKVRHKQGATETEFTISGDGWQDASSVTWTPRSQAFTNDLAAGTNVEINMTDTSGFEIGDVVKVTSGTGSENAVVTVVHANTHLTVDCLLLDHNTTGRVVQHASTLPVERAYTNDPAAGANIELNMADTTGFAVGDVVEVSSSAGRENAHITVVHANTHITVNTLALNHTTTAPLVRMVVQYTFIVDTSADLSASIGLGDKVKFTDTTVKNFIVHNIVTTRLTLFGGTDYSIVGTAAVTSPSYSHAKSPFGFPLDPVKWSVEVSDTGDRSQATPVASTWYNAFSISLPIGSWNTSYKCMVEAYKAASTVQSALVTLSNANNTESDSDWRTGAISGGASGTLQVFQTCATSKRISVTTRTSEYLNMMSTTVPDLLDIRGDLVKTIIRAVSAYI